MDDVIDSADVIFVYVPFSKELNVKLRSLRAWDKQGLLRNERERNSGIYMVDSIDQEEADFFARRGAVWVL